MQYNIHIEPINGHLRIRIPEIDATLETTGNTRDEAVKAAHLAIVNHLMQKRGLTHKISSSKQTV